MARPGACLPPADARVRATIEAVERRLMPNGFVLRYDTAATKDGLPQAAV
jgi:GH15 family glucan-1,4-alpha-glucosidase